MIEVLLSWLVPQVGHVPVLLAFDPISLIALAGPLLGLLGGRGGGGEQVSGQIDPRIQQEFLNALGLERQKQQTTLPLLERSVNLADFLLPGPNFFAGAHEGALVRRPPTDFSQMAGPGLFSLEDVLNTGRPSFTPSEGNIRIALDPRDEPFASDPVTQRFAQGFLDPRSNPAQTNRELTRRAEGVAARAGGEMLAERDPDIDIDMVPTVDDFIELFDELDRISGGLGGIQTGTL